MEATVHGEEPMFPKKTQLHPFGSAPGDLEVADDPGSIRRSIRMVVRVRLVRMKTPKPFSILKG